MNKGVSKAIIDLVLDFSQAPQNYSNLVDIQKPLPEGVGLLLEFVTNAHNSNEDFKPYQAKGLSPEKFVEFSSFFIEKVLFVKGADYYRELGLNPGATLPQVHRHFELLMNLFCKEKGAIDWNKANFARFNHAYGVLSNVKKREIYDLQMGTGKAKDVDQSNNTPTKDIPVTKVQSTNPGSKIEPSKLEKIKAKITAKDPVAPNVSSHADIHADIDPEKITITHPGYVETSQNMNVEWPDYDLDFTQTEVDSESKSLILRGAPKFLTKFRPTVMVSLILTVGALGFYMFSSDSEPNKLSAVELRKGIAVDSDIAELLADRRSSDQQQNEPSEVHQTSEALMANSVSGSIEIQQFDDTDSSNSDQIAQTENIEEMTQAMRLLNSEDRAKSSLMEPERLSSADRMELTRLAMADNSLAEEGLLANGEKPLHQDEVSFEQVVNDLEENGSVVQRMETGQIASDESPVNQLENSNVDGSLLSDRSTTNPDIPSEPVAQNYNVPVGDVGMRVRFEIPNEESAVQKSSSAKSESETAFSVDEFIIPSEDSDAQKSVSLSTEQPDFNYFEEKPIYETSSVSLEQDLEYENNSEDVKKYETEIAPVRRVKALKEPRKNVATANNIPKPEKKAAEKTVKLAKVDTIKKANPARQETNTVVSDSASDQIVVIVNSQNNESITEDDVKNIYSDNVSSWNSGKLIEVYNLPVNEPLRDVFSVEVLGISSREAAAEEKNRRITNTIKNQFKTKRERLVVANVASKESAIGYVRRSSLKGKKGVRIIMTLDKLN